MTAQRSRALWTASVLLFLVPILILLATAYSETNAYSAAAHGKSAANGPIDALRVLIHEWDSSGRGELLKLRLFRALCATAVGGALALAGAMMQGLFRNPLAEPGLLGVSSGAALGSILGISILGGYGLGFTLWKTSTSESLAAQSGTVPNSVGLMLIPLLAMAGAFIAALAVYRIATRHGRISIPALLLTGLAINALLNALMASVQVLLLQDWQVSRAIIAWGFGTLDDRTPFHLALVWGGAIFALFSIPFVGLELDMLAGGEEDSAALGADPSRVKTIVLICVALATATSVSVCGQIAFVGLLVPQIARILVGPRHRTLLPISFLTGSVLLLCVVVFQHGVCPVFSGWAAANGSTRLATLFMRITSMQPGVVTSLLGAPCFLLLLLRQERRGAW